MTPALSIINHLKAKSGKPLIHTIILFFLFQFIHINKTLAQSVASKDSTFLLTTTNTAYENYIATFGKKALFYSGAEYIRPATSTKGHPFLEHDKPQKGNVSFDGVLYTDVMIALDIVSNVLTTVGYHNIQLQLPTEKINYFTLNNRLFIPLWDQATTKGKQSFYEVLYQNELKVLASHKKTSAQSFRPEDPYVFKESVTYFIQTSEQLIRINNEKALLETLEDEKGTLKKFIRNNHLKFDKMPAETIIKTVEYYQQLKK